MSDINSMLGIIAILFALALGLLPNEAPAGKKVSMIFYGLAWCALAGTVLSFLAETDVVRLGGFGLLTVGYLGAYVYFAKGGTVYVSR